MEKERFLSIILVYAAHVDYNFCDNERGFILKNVSQDHFNYALELMERESHSMVFNLINDNILSFYSTDTEQESLLNILFELFNCDDDFSNFEQSFMNYLKLIFESDFQCEVSAQIKR